MLRVSASLAASAMLILVTPAQAQQATEKEEPEPLVFTNDDLPSPSPADVLSQPAQQTPSPPAAAGSAPVLIDEHRDRNGHGEGWWRHRAAVLELKIYGAYLDAQELHVDYVQGKKLVDPTLPSRSRAATELVLKLEAEREGLAEELRQAGGFPGWLRWDGRFVPSEPPPIPVLEKVIPASRLLTLAWQPVMHAAFYMVEVECTDCCERSGSCDVRTIDLKGTSVQLPLEDGGAGRWRVRALNVVGLAGEWSPWDSFETSTP